MKLIIMTTSRVKMRIFINLAWINKSNWMLCAGQEGATGRRCKCKIESGFVITQCIITIYFYALNDMHSEVSYENFFQNIRIKQLLDYQNKIIAGIQKQNSCCNIEIFPHLKWHRKSGRFKNSMQLCAFLFRNLKQHQESGNFRILCDGRTELGIVVGWVGGTLAQ